MAIGLLNLDEDFFKRQQGTASDMNALRDVVGAVGERMAEKRGLQQQAPQLVQPQQNRMVPIVTKEPNPLLVVNPGPQGIISEPGSQYSPMDMLEMVNAGREDIIAQGTTYPQGQTTMFNAGQVNAPIYEMDTSGIAPITPEVQAIKAVENEENRSGSGNEQSTFLKRLYANLKDDPRAASTFFADAAMAFNTLRLKPDAGLNAAMQARIKSNTDLGTLNKTANYFSSMNTPAGDKAAAWILAGGDVKKAMDVFNAENMKSGASAFGDYPDLQDALSKGLISTANAFTIKAQREAADRAEKGKEEILTAEQFKTEFGFDVPEEYKGKVLQRNTKTGDITVVSGAAPSTTINMGEKLDVEQFRGRLSYATSEIGKYRDANTTIVNAQRSTQQVLKRIQPLLDDFSKVQIGSPQFNDTVVRLSKQFEALGLDTGMADSITTADQFNAAVKELVQQQLRLNKGPQTDFDAIFASNTLPNLGNSKEANDAIINYLDSQAEWSLIRESVNKQAYRAALSDPLKAAELVFEIEDYFNSVPAVMTLPNGKNQTLSEFKKQARRIQPNVNDLDIIHAWKKQEAEIRGQDYNAVPHPKDVMGL